MSFIKHGDGKIMSVIDEDQLTEEQKKSAKDSTKKSKVEHISSSSETENSEK